MEKVSVIIPVYNGEHYITQCVRSVMNQTYRNLEILIIEDGSDDGSLDLCKELCRCDERIHVFEQANAGVSEARNRGLDMATGEYVFFLDADDAIPQFLIEKFVCQARRQHTEIIMCNCRKRNNAQMEQLESETDKEGESAWIIGQGEQSEEWFHIKYKEELSSIGGKMFERKSIGELRFDKNLRFGEDTLFMYFMACKHVRIAYCRQDWYYYRMRADSATHSGKTMKKEEYFECIRIIRDKEYEKNKMRFALVWERALLSQMVKSFSKLKRSGDEEGSQSIKKQAVTERAHPLFQKAGRDIKAIYFSCFFCYPLYGPFRIMLHIVQDLLDVLWIARQKFGKTA